MGEQYVYIGTYSQNESSIGLSRGIYVYRFDSRKGELSYHGSEDDRFNPTYLALSENGRFLYAADEVGGETVISAYNIDQESGQLDFINRKCFAGSGLCNLNVSKDGRLLFGANYGSGSVVSVKVDGNGGVGELGANIVHEGKSVHKERQTHPYAHCAMPDRENKFLIACDLGTDKLYAYAITPVSGALSFSVATDVPPGEGPRHLIFDKAGERAFLVTEMGNKVIMYDYDGQTGAMAQRQMLDMLPEGVDSESITGADIHLSPDETRLFASVRDIAGGGRDGIACYVLKNGQWVADGMIPTEKIPRGFEVSPDGRYLIVCCQNANCIQVFDVESRHLVSQIQTPAPVCVKFG